VVAAATACLAPMTDPAATGAQPLAGMTIDGTHPSLAGGYQVGKAIAAILSCWYPPLDLLPTNGLTWNWGLQNANFHRNPMMVGSGGSVAAPATGTISGTAPTNCTVAMSDTAGLTVAHSQVTSPLTGLRMHQMSFSGSYTASGVATANWAPWGRLYCSASGAASDTLKAGDRIEALIAFEIDAGHNCIAFPRLELRWKGTGGYNSDMQMPEVVGVLPPETIQGVLRTPVHDYAASELPLAAGELAMDARAYLRAENGTYSPSGTIRFGRALIRKL